MSIPIFLLASSARGGLEQGWLVLILYFVFTLIAIIVYLVLRKYSPESKNSVVLISTFSVLDFVTDCLFVYDTFSLGLASLFFPAS